MLISRRVVLTGAASTSLLALLAQSAQAQPSTRVRMIDGWAQAQLTPDAVARLNDVGATVFATRPSEMVTTGNTPTVRIPLRAGAFHPNFTELMANASGGIGVRMPSRELHVDLVAGEGHAVRRDGKVEVTGQGTMLLNGERTEIGPVSSTAMDEIVVTVEPSKPGKPNMVRAEAPVHVTEVDAERLAEFLGTPVFDAGMRIAHAVGQCRYWPPR
jgi:hypothetical protein